ncbi:MAG: NAD(P)/FAD-dependent oxidoreductase [Amphritea sp.]
MAEKVDAVVVGAGVVGLAIARKLALSGLEVVLLEAASAIGSETSSRNSGVIHAGIYYPHESLKARLCVRGKELLYAYCDQRKIPHRRIGKLIVATSLAQQTTLEALTRQGEENGVEDLEYLSAGEVTRMEPNIEALSALYSPSTGIVDSSALMLSYLGDMEAAGGILALNAPVKGVQVRIKGFRLYIGGADPMMLDTELLVNSTGLHMNETLANIDGFPDQCIPVLYYAKGNYFSLSGRAPFSHLVYPVPEAGGLGIHATLDLAGQVRFGPDVEWVDRYDYQVSSHRLDTFYGAIASYFPTIDRSRLTPDYAGIRPKLSPPNGAPSDFIIQGEETHGIAGMINLLGIESPGLTASLAIAEEVHKGLGLAP